jgi:4-hydroxybenzoate polyprenyltransferase
VFAGVLALYYLVTLSYSFRFKGSPIIDVLILAGLYTLRLIAGGTAITIELSFWLLAFSMFLFLSLALVKRFTELILMDNMGEEAVAGRGYRRVDLETLAQFGSASGYMAALVLALYINSREVKILYAQPELIWLLCPLVLYLVSRIWLVARRGELHDDPVIFVIQDRRSLMVAGLSALLLWAAT